MGILTFMTTGHMPFEIHPSPAQNPRLFKEMYLKAERQMLRQRLGSINFAENADRAIKEIKANNLVVEVREGNTGSGYQGCESD